MYEHYLIDNPPVKVDGSGAIDNEYEEQEKEIETYSDPGFDAEWQSLDEDFDRETVGENRQSSEVDGKVSTETFDSQEWEEVD